MENRWIPILCYHRVCPENEIGSDSRSLCVFPGAFDRQMRLLKLLGYKTLSPQNLAACLQGRKNAPPKSVVLSFDDGYEDNYTHAFPILKKYGLTASVYLVTDFVGKKNSWDSGNLFLLKEGQIREMAMAGMVFGSHTASHMDMTAEKSGKIREDLLKSKKKLEELTSRFDIPFCYPYSRVNDEARNLVKECGYLCGLSGDHGPLKQDEDLFNLMRIQIFPSNSLFDFWRKLQPWYPSWLRYTKAKKSA